ncbi:MAG: 4-hydroxy-tetrahydrodipicolinate reductase [Clostridiales bacterium]|jgi:4-hydroxy-tetrahydrodipicolinate reductase|nr:4-hydroxy-tetrahydrodipicolinate reductase [Clostridiales bacterium]
MFSLFVFGAAGKMGQALGETAALNGVTVVGGFDIRTDMAGPYPIYSEIEKVPGNFDVIVDFSRPQLLPGIIALSDKYHKPAVIATTGHNASETADILSLAERTAVLKSGNMSIGVNLLLSLVEEAARALGDAYDIEIVEKHHNQKVDAPSGTAEMLANAVKRGRAVSRTVYGRHGDSLRQKGELGIHAVRGGTTVGEHDVIFAGRDETITLSHAALSRKIFSSGALRAALFVADKPPGLYTMQDAIGDTP